MPYAIYPPIGFGRIGNSPDYYLAPETPGSLGLEFDGSGAEQEVSRFKDDAFRIKRKGVRFHLFDVSDPAAPIAAVLPEGTIVRWSVTVANVKDAIRRPVGPPSFPAPVRDDPARADRAIRAAAEVAGPGAPAETLAGTHLAVPVTLGEIHTDAEQRLIFLGGLGRSGTDGDPTDIGGSFYNNANWYDDVCDGSVEATVEIPGEPAVDAASAWIVTAPPDYSPPSLGVVTLYDVVREVALAKGWIEAAASPSFESDIRPMIERTRSLQWVDQSADWGAISDDWAALADASPAQAQLRELTVEAIREVENQLRSFALRDWQSAALDAYAAGDFTVGATPDRGDCDRMTRVELDGTVGQGFFPGIEAGINMTDPQLYATPFEYRFRAGALRPGDATAHMAQPWQADFLKCGEHWWPAQRPFIVRQADGSTKEWIDPPMDHAGLVENAMKLGVATPDGTGKVVEQGRDPVLGT